MRCFKSHARKVIPENDFGQVQNEFLPEVDSSVDFGGSGWLYGLTECSRFRFGAERIKAGSRFAVEWIGSKLEFGKVGSLRSEPSIISGQNCLWSYLEQYLGYPVRPFESVIVFHGNRHSESFDSCKFFGPWYGEVYFVMAWHWPQLTLNDHFHPLHNYNRWRLLWFQLWLTAPNEFQYEL